MPDKSDEKAKPEETEKVIAPPEKLSTLVFTATVDGRQIAGMTVQANPDALKLGSKFMVAKSEAFTAKLSQVPPKTTRVGK